MLPYIGQPIYYRLWHISGTVECPLVQPKGHFTILFIIDSLLDFFSFSQSRNWTRNVFLMELRPSQKYVPCLNNCVQRRSFHTPLDFSMLCNFMICNYAWKNTLMMRSDVIVSLYFIRKGLTIFFVLLLFIGSNHRAIILTFPDLLHSILECKDRVLHRFHLILHP